MGIPFKVVSIGCHDIYLVLAPTIQRRESDISLDYRHARPPASLVPNFEVFSVNHH